MSPSDSPEHPAPPENRPLRARLAGDLLGGVIAALLALPYGLAMASLMGLPPISGVFTSIIGAPFIALLGRNGFLIGGVSSVTVPFIAAAVHDHGPGGAALIGVMASIILIAFSLARMGRHIMHVPAAVVSGFSSGIGGFVIISQLPSLLGVAAPAGAGALSPLAQLAALLGHLNEARFAPFLIGATVVAAATICARVSALLPAPLIGVALAIIVARLLGLHERPLGALPAALPHVASVAWDFHAILALMPPALCLALVMAINILITSRVVEHFRGRHEHMRPADADAELRAYGVANFAAAIFGAPPGVGVPARSLAVIKSGGQTCAANLIHAACLILILRLGSGLVGAIPLCALGGVTMWIGLSLVNVGAWRRVHRLRPIDAAAFVLTAASVLAFNSMLAVALGCSLYLLRGLTQPRRAPAPARAIKWKPPAI